MIKRPYIGGGITNIDSILLLFMLVMYALEYSFYIFLNSINIIIYPINAELTILSFSNEMGQFFTISFLSFET